MEHESIFIMMMMMWLFSVLMITVNMHAHIFTDIIEKKMSDEKFDET